MARRDAGRGTGLAPDDFTKAYEKALTRLRRSDAFEIEIRELLVRNGCDATAIESVVSRLLAKGLLDDERVLAALIEQGLHKGHGPLKIAHSLEGRGLDSALVASEIQDVDPERWRVAALTALRLKPMAGRFKAARFLASRGFDEDQIEQAVLASFDEANEVG